MVYPTTLGTILIDNPEEYIVATGLGFTYGAIMSMNISPSFKALITAPLAYDVYSRQDRPEKIIKCFTFGFMASSTVVSLVGFRRSRSRSQHN